MSNRLALRVGEDLIELLETEDVFHVEAVGGDSRLRTRSRRFYESTERLADVAARLPEDRFFSPHRSHVVNLDRVRQVRRRVDGRGWELKLDPPVNAVIPVSRSRETELWQRLGLPR